MKSFREKVLRPCRCWTDILPIAWILLFFVTLFGELFSYPIIRITRMRELTLAVAGSEDAAKFMMMYFRPIGSWAAALFVMWIFKKNRPMLQAIRHDGRGNSVKGALAGLGIGFGMNALCILISALTGKIRLTFDHFDLVNLLLFFVFVFIQSGSEELLLRVYLYQKLRRRYRHPAVAIIGSAALFSALHALNPGYNMGGAAQIFIVAVLFSLIIYYYGSFWAIAMAHTGWNYTQSILFGLPNSGIVSAYSLFKLDAASAADGLFYNVGFGVEGTPGSSAVIAVVAVIVFILGRRGTYREDLWKKQEKTAAEKAAAPAAVNG